MEAASCQIFNKPKFTSNDGTSNALPGDAFWGLPAKELARYCDGWLISESEFTEDWPTWEMHPQGDEFVYLPAGAADLLLDRDGELETVSVNGTGVVLLQCGVWHTATVRQPSRALM